MHKLKLDADALRVEQFVVGKAARGEVWARAFTLGEHTCANTCPFGCQPFTSAATCRC
jgi:hypothetical protein